MSDIQKEIKEALEKATPGEWYLEDDGDDELVVMAPDPEVPGRSSSVFGFDPELYYSKEDAHLIANAPTWLLYQQELIEQLQEREFNHYPIVIHDLESRIFAQQDSIAQKDAEIAKLREIQKGAST